MKLLIIGADEKAAIEQVYIKYLKEYNIEISFFPAQNLFSNFYNKNIFNKVFFRLGISNIYSNINDILKERIEEFSPEIIWIFKGMEILPKTLKWAENKDIKLINYNPDNPFIFSGHGSGNKNVTNSIRLFHEHITYDHKVRNRIVNEFNIPTNILPFGFEISSELFAKVQNTKEMLKTCFIGNPDAGRVTFLNELAKRGINLDVYGHNWNEVNLHENIKIFDPLYGDHFYKVLRKYRIQLNIMRKHNLQSHNMRSFEIPAIGGIMLAPNTPDHHNFFEEGKEFFSYKDVDNCVITIHNILALTVSQAQEIRNAARTKSVNADYSYQHRSKKVMEILTRLYES